MLVKNIKIQVAFIIYWIMLAYIIAALVFWFFALTKQNEQMSVYKLERLSPASSNYTQAAEKIRKERKTKIAQYVGEGSTFLILIIAGAIFVFRIVRRQLRQSKEQQNFLISITHELKTPIAVTKLNLETLQKRKLDESQQQRLIYNSLTEANRLNDLCNNLLLSSQLQSKVYKMVKEQVDLTGLLHRMIHELIQRYPLQQVQFDIADEIYVLGDENLLQMVVNNLFDNAIKYSGKECRITVRLLKEKHNAILTIGDNGPGISALEREKIFTKFYRIGNEATKKAKGTGLGLFLCRKIINAHKGKISVNENNENGSDFNIILPMQNSI